MRSNDNLVKINEKLIIELSPHTKMNTKPLQPKQEKNGGKKSDEKETDKK